jgi:hypothetical protein
VSRLQGLQGRRALLLLGLVLAVGLGIERALTLAQAAPTDFDDAYMYLRYAKHVLAGYGVSWNAGEGGVYGVTSLLHLGAVTVAMVFFPRLSAAGTLQVVSGAAGLALLAGLVALAALVCRDRRLRGNGVLWAVVLVPLIAFHDSFVFHAGTGMDTLLSALANTAVALATIRLARAPSLTTASWSAVASLVAVLARPDNVLCAILCPGLALLLLAPAPRRKAAVVFGVFLIAGLATLALTTTFLLGSPLPLSFFAKQPGYYGDFAGEYAWNPYLFLRVFLATAWPFVVAAMVFAERKSWRQLVVLLAPPLASLAMLFLFNQIMGHLGRFDYPFLPFFVAAGILEVDGFMAGHQSAPSVAAWLASRKAFVRAAAAGVVLAAGNVALSLAADAYEARGQEHRASARYAVPATQPLPDIDSWQAAHAVAAMAAAGPAGASFAMSEHGLPGALAPDLRIVDVLGLHDPYFAHHGFSVDELLRRQPDVIWLPHADHGAMVHAIVGSKEFWRHYELFPDAFFHGIALRTDGPRYLQVAAAFRQQWQALYSGLQPEDYRARAPLESELEADAEKDAGEVQVPDGRVAVGVARRRARDVEVGGAEHERYRDALGARGTKR